MGSSEARLIASASNSVCLWPPAEEMNVVGATSAASDDLEVNWNPGELKFYGRAELKTSDHR